MHTWGYNIPYHEWSNEWTRSRCTSEVLMGTNERCFYLQKPLSNEI